MIGLPAGYYISGLILGLFNNRTEITSSLFFIVLLIVLILAVSVVLLQAIKAALANPVDSLKYE